MSIGLYAANDLLCVLGNGNVGIGTTAPSHKFHVAGRIYSHTSDVDGIIIKRNSSYGAYIRYLAANQDAKGWRVGCDSNDYFDFEFSTDTFSSSSYKVRIDSSGNLLTYGGVTMYSDQRKKTILNHVELSLKQIADAPLIEHYYNSDEKKTTHVGSIAQYWASINDWFCKLDSEGFYTMEIQNAALASAISIARELDRYETKTDKDIKKLKKRICELEEEVERLKSA
jgi:hypothetical protein